MTLREVSLTALIITRQHFVSAAQAGHSAAGHKEDTHSEYFDLFTSLNYSYYSFIVMISRYDLLVQWNTKSEYEQQMTKA